MLTSLFGNIPGKEAGEGEGEGEGSNEATSADLMPPQPAPSQVIGIRHFFSCRDRKNIVTDARIHFGNPTFSSSLPNSIIYRKKCEKGKLVSTETYRAPRLSCTNDSPWALASSVKIRLMDLKVNYSVYFPTWSTQIPAYVASYQLNEIKQKTVYGWHEICSHHPSHWRIICIVGYVRRLN
jgi:hypothetical protein